MIIRINDTELSWLGLAREEVVGKRRLPEFLSEKSRETFRREFPKMATSGRADEMEMELRRADGRVMPVLISATALRDPKGEFHGRVPWCWTIPACGRSRRPSAR